MRRELVLLCLLVAAVTTVACNEPEKAVKPKVVQQNILTKHPATASIANSTMTCKLARVQYGKLVQIYRIRNERYPKNLLTLQNAGMIQSVIPCAGGGTYTIDDKGIVRCSVHDD